MENRLTNLIQDKELKKSFKNLEVSSFEKIRDIYRKKVKVKDGWWYDESGLITGGLGHTQQKVKNIINRYVIHLPHSQVEIPQEYRADYLLSDEELEDNIYQYADYKTDELYKSFLENCDSVINPHSRLFMDPERFFDDEKESMQVKHGLGWFYENAILEKKPLRVKTHKDEIAKYYDAHHNKLTSLVEKKLELYDACTIIDCHSFSNERYWFHDKSVELPDICIGYDEFHKDEQLVKVILDLFKDYNITINTPYAGSLVPNKFYMKDSRVKSVMIEINKKLYLESDNTTKSENFRVIRDKLTYIQERV